MRIQHKRIKQEFEPIEITITLTSKEELVNLHTDVANMYTKTTKPLYILVTRLKKELV